MSKTNQKKKKISLTKEFAKEARILINQGNINGAKELVLDDNSKELFRLITFYFMGNTKFNESKLIMNKSGGYLNKGLFIYGSYGVGKTLSFRTINSLAKKNKIFKPPLWYKMFSAFDIVSEHNMNGDQSLSILFSGNVYIDDLGNEPIGNHFGKRDVLTQVLEKRYRLFTEQKLKTFITSNLNPAEYKNRYGERNYDRMFEMFNVIKIKNTKSYRE